MIMKKLSFLYYVIEVVYIGGTFVLLLELSLTLYSQLLLLFLMLIFYIAIGLWFHKKNHNINAKVVLEYILICVLIYTLFIFLNISKI